LGFRVRPPKTPIYRARTENARYQSDSRKLEVCLALAGHWHTDWRNLHMYVLSHDMCWDAQQVSVSTTGRSACFHCCFGHTTTGAVFRRVRKIAKSDYYLRHVRPSAWNNSARTERILTNCDIWVFKYLSKKIQVSKNPTKITSTRTRFHIYDNVSLNSSYSEKCVKARVHSNHTHVYTRTHTLRIYFSTATMATRTRLSATLCVHGLSYLMLLLYTSVSVSFTVCSYTHLLKYLFAVYLSVPTPGCLQN
jgi:hypothetical protein